MNLRRLSTSSPISVVKIRSVATKIFQPNRQQRPLLRIHRGVGKLLGVHFAQPLVALHGSVALAFDLHVLQQIAPAGDAYRDARSSAP